MNSFSACIQRWENLGDLSAHPSAESMLSYYTGYTLLANRQGNAWFLIKGLLWHRIALKYFGETYKEIILILYHGNTRENFIVGPD